MAPLRRIIDLTHPIAGGMPVYPGDPEVRLEAVSLIKDTGYHVTEICMGTHTGTHIDAPMHCLPGAKGVDSAPLNALVGPAEVLNLGDLPPKTEITAAHLDRFSKRVEEGARVLLRTGWSKHFGSPDFFTEYPGLTEGAAVWLNARKVQLVGIEQPSVHLTQDRDVHVELLSQRVVLVEWLANLDQITQDQVYLIVLPLRIVGVDGSPVRAIAIEGE